MKRLLLSLTAFVAMVSLGSADANAQKAQLQIGYGGYTMMDCTDMHDGGSVNTAWGALTAGINFNITRNLSLGGTYTFSSSSYKHSHDHNIYYHVVMLNGRYNYYRTSMVTLYGHLGIGVDFSHMTHGDGSKNRAYFACQVSPLGAEVSLSRVTSLFGEAGFGAQGLLQVGFRFNI